MDARPDPEIAGLLRQRLEPGHQQMRRYGLEREPSRGSSWSSYGQGAEQEGRWTERIWQSPSREPTVGADVAVPLLQSLASGAMAGLALIAPTVGWHWRWYVPLLGACLITVGAWLLLILDHRRLLWTVERWTGRDLDGDGQAGPPPKPKTVRVEVAERARGHQTTRLADLPVSEELLTDVAIAVLRQGRGLSRGGLSHVLSDPAYRQLRRSMLEAGLARAEGKQTELTPAGRAYLRHYLPENRRQESAGEITVKELEG
jgi:hypothetical protein